MEYNILETGKELRAVVPHPWRRWFARGLDMFLYGMIVQVLEIFVFKLDIPMNFISNLAYAYIVLGIMIVLEPLLLATFGTTIGKLIFGLKIRKLDGSKLSYAEGLNRILILFSKGYGYGLPIYNLVRAWKGRVECLEGRENEWDEGLSYEIKDTKAWRIVVYILVYVIMYIIIFCIGFYMIAVESYRAYINEPIIKQHYMMDHQDEEIGDKQNADL